jgi:hypothetical protein
MGEGNGLEKNMNADVISNADLLLVIDGGLE